MNQLLNATVKRADRMVWYARFSSYDEEILRWFVETIEEEKELEHYEYIDKASKAEIIEYLTNLKMGICQDTTALKR